jgi:hypothetical protein
MPTSITIEYLVQMCERALVSLGQQKSAAERLGDLERIDMLNSKIAETEATLEKLRTIPA